MLQKSQKKQQGHNKSYRNWKNRNMTAKKLIGKEKRATGTVLSWNSLTDLTFISDM